MRHPSVPIHGLLARPQNAAFVPHWLIRLGDLPTLAEHQKAVEIAGEPAIVGHSEHRSFEPAKRLLQSFRRNEVEVIGWLIQQQESCAPELEKQNLEACLLPTRESVE